MLSAWVETLVNSSKALPRDSLNSTALASATSMGVLCFNYLARRIGRDSESVEGRGTAVREEYPVMNSLHCHQFGPSDSQKIPTGERGWSHRGEEEKMQSVYKQIHA